MKNQQPKEKKIKKKEAEVPVEEVLPPGEDITDDIPADLVDTLADVLATDAPISSANGDEKLDEIYEVDVKKHTHTESSIQWYLEEINKIPLLTRAEEDMYARKANAGDEKAKEKLITANLRFVVQVAKKYQKYGISLLDLINEGNMGLIKAAERFDPDMGFHFISYAVWWIRQAIILAINQKVSIIRLPMNRTIDLHRIEKVQKELENEMGVEPTIVQVAERLDLPVEEVKWLKQISADYVSLDAPLGNDSENTQISTIEDDKYESPETEAMNKALHDAINSILYELTVSEREIIEYRFGLNGKQRISLTQAGKKFNLSKERVRQIEKKTLLKLQKYGHKKELEAFLPGR